MAAAIHTRYRNGRIRAWTKDGKGIMSLIVPCIIRGGTARRQRRSPKSSAGPAFG
jgi:hypothetical protein